MGKKKIGILLVLAALLGGAAWLFGGREIYSGNGVVLDVSGRREGHVSVLAVNEKRLKARLTREGEEYTYDLPGDGSATVFPLSQGPGKYTATVYESTSGDWYKVIFQEKFTAGFDPKAPFLHPNQIVNYTADSAAVRKAEELTAGLAGDVERIDAILAFVTENLTYDQAKADTVESGYLPDVDAALAGGKGICQDYAALTAAMLRGVGIPCKMEVGYISDGQYHAWVRVWSEEEEGTLSCGLTVRADRYTLLDPTFLSGGGRTEYVLDTTNYRTQFTY